MTDNNEKFFITPGYKYMFNNKTGVLNRWGETFEDNPDFSPYGPEIADIEISTVCHGVAGIGPCKFCYKSNTGKGEYMTFERFKEILSALLQSQTLTQIAFGIGDIDGNPDMRDIFEYTRVNGIVPNVTINGEDLDDTDWIEWLGKTCGAVAVSLYDKEKTYRTLRLLREQGLKQTNIHFMISEETYDKCLEVINDFKSNYQGLKDNLNALVLLSLKPKGRAKGHFSPLAQEKFNNLVKLSLESNVPLGFDSCSAHKFTTAIKTMAPERYQELESLIEPCESTLFSVYINTQGVMYPCSFLENEEGFTDFPWGLKITNHTDFVKDIWMHEFTKSFRNKVIDNNKQCSNCSNGCVYYRV